MDALFVGVFLGKMSFFPVNPPRQQCDGGLSSRIPSTQVEKVAFTPPTWYEGIVQQQNSGWNAQIIFNNRLILLRTFKFEVAATRAYDSVTSKVKGRDFYRNFLLTNVTIHEPSFQSMYSTKAILDMNMNGSYESKFIDIVWNHHYHIRYRGYVAIPNCLNSIQGVLFKEMFHKKLTLNGVENQNILVLTYCLYYPPFMSTGGLQLEFKERMNRSWVFQYYYSNSTWSYIFNMGWSKFVNEMELHTKDIVIFYRCMDWRKIPPKVFEMVDIIRDVSSTGNP